MRGGTTAGTRHASHCPAIGWIFIIIVTFIYKNKSQHLFEVSHHFALSIQINLSGPLFIEIQSKYLIWWSRLRTSILTASLSRLSFSRCRSRSLSVWDNAWDGELEPEAGEELFDDGCCRLESSNCICICDALRAFSKASSSSRSRCFSLSRRCRSLSCSSFCRFLISCCSCSCFCLSFLSLACFLNISNVSSADILLRLPPPDADWARLDHEPKFFSLGSPAY